MGRRSPKNDYSRVYFDRHGGLERAIKQSNGDLVVNTFNYMTCHHTPTFTNIYINLRAYGLSKRQDAKGPEVIAGCLTHEVLHSVIFNILLEDKVFHTIGNQVMSKSPCDGHWPHVRGFDDWWYLNEYARLNTDNPEAFRSCPVIYDEYD